MNFKKWLKSIQTVNNNGAHTVNGIKPPLNLAKPAKTFLFSSWNWADNFDRALWIQPILIFDPFHHKFIWIEVIPMIYQQNLHYIFARMILLHFDKTNLLKYRNLQIEFMLFDLAWNSTTYFFYQHHNLPVFCAPYGCKHKCLRAVCYYSNIKHMFGRHARRLFCSRYHCKYNSPILIHISLSI